MPFEQIAKLLEQRIGLTVDSVGASTIERAINIRMTHCKIDDIDIYQNLLTQSATEFTDLIETVIVPETWFFRDFHPFVSLKEHVQSLTKNAADATPLRILSIPCSTGEEPYSIAMSLLDIGLTRKDFIIDAIDISFNNIQNAQRGQYRANSFRGNYTEFMDKHFAYSNDVYSIFESVKRCVNFLQGNVFDANFVEFLPSYNIIFCRNLLIYFDQERQQKCFQILHQKLDQQGIIFLGHAESFTALQAGYTPTKYARSFAFYRAKKEQQILTPPAPTPAEPVIQPHRSIKSKSVKFDAEKKHVATQPAVTTAPDAAAKEDAEVNDALEQAQRLADQGKLQEAEAICIKHLDQYTTSAAAHYILGLIREASSDKTLAIENFRKTIYLDPDHYAALIHLATLADTQGDEKSAQIYRQRAERAQQRNRPGLLA